MIRRAFCVLAWATLRGLLMLLLLLTQVIAGAAAHDPPPEAIVATLPFAPSREANRVMVDLAPEGGRPFVMLLDTGASESVVTPGMARDLGVRVRKLKDTPYRRSTRLGRDLQFWVDTSSSDTGSRSGWEYGLLGGEFIDDYVVEIDFPGRQVRFLDAKRFAVPETVDAADEHVVPVKRSATRISVPIRVNGHEVYVLLDTGDPGTGVLSGQAAREAGIDVASLPAFGSVGTVVGEMRTSLFEEPAFQLGGIALGPVALRVAPKGWYNQAGPNDSTIGYDLLSPFVIRIDYARRRLWLKHVERRPIRFDGADYALAKQTGAFMNPGPQGHFVWAVLPNSPAEKLGVRAGDVIVSSETAAAPPVEEVLHRILEGRDLQVARRQGELWVDTLLPEEAPAAD